MAPRIYMAAISMAALSSAFLLAGCSGEGVEDQSAPNSAPAQSATAPAAVAINAKANADIAALKARADVQAAFAAFQAMNAVNVERLIAMTEIPAPPFAESARAQDLADRFKTAGISDVTIDDVGNVIARRPGKTGARTHAVIAHIDTVFPAETDVTVRREGNTYFAPGIGDNSQGLVAMLSVIDAMSETNMQTEDDLLFIGSVGEEGLGDLRGVRYIFRENGPKIDSVIAIDGGNGNRLVVDAVGSNRYRVTFSGPGGHSYGAFGRAHPHQALSEAIRNFTLNATPVTQLDGARATFSVGRIGGGTSINSIPFTSWMEVDMRSTDPAKLAKLDAAFQQAMTDALKTENDRRTQNDALTVEVKPVGKRPAGKGDRNSSLVQTSVAAMRATGMTPTLTASSTDGNIPISLGIPTITMARGGISRNAHAPNESWENKDPHLAYEVLLLTLLAESGLTESGG